MRAYELLHIIWVLCVWGTARNRLQKLEELSASTRGEERDAVGDEICVDATAIGIIGVVEADSEAARVGIGIGVWNCGDSSAVGEAGDDWSRWSGKVVSNRELSRSWSGLEATA